MNHFTITLLFLSLSLGLFSCKKNRVDKIETPQGFIENDWNTVLLHAKNNNRNVFILFYATWCEHCENFKKNTLNDPEVESYMNAHFAAGTLDAERDKGLELFTQYSFPGYPTLAVFDQDGNLLTSKNAVLTPQEFLEWINPYE